MSLFTTFTLMGMLLVSAQETWAETPTLAESVSTNPVQATNGIPRLDLNVVSGDVTITIDPNATAIQVTPVNGQDKISITKNAGNVTVEETPRRLASSAQVEVVVPQNVAIHFKATSGDLTIHGTPASLQANSVSGAITVHYDAINTGTTKIGTVSGDIQLEVPANSQFQGLARSSKGSVSGKELYSQKASYDITAGSQTGDIRLASY